MAGKGDKNRTTDHIQVRKNHGDIKGLNNFVPDWMKRKEKVNGRIKSRRYDI